MSDYKGISLHIGLNSVDPSHYGGWSGPLQACERDARSMSEIAEYSNFETRVLLTENATLAAVISSISHIAHELNSGDFFFLTYSGHGGQVPDKNRDEPDAQDETWCLYDSQLIDDQIFMLLSKFKSGVRIFVMSDSCHSGTVLKQKSLPPKECLEFLNEDLNITVLPYKVMPSDIALKTYDQNKDYYDPILKDRNLIKTQENIQASAILISGCQDYQLSLDGTFNGMFTGAVLYTWNDGEFAGNYRSFRDNVTSHIHPSYDQTPNYYVVGQNTSGFENQAILRI